MIASEPSLLSWGLLPFNHDHFFMGIHIALITDQWSVTLNTLGLLGLAIMQALGLFWSKRNHENSNLKIEGVQGQVSAVAGEVQQVRQAVDGPLGHALENAATALELAADITRDPDRILQAVAARKISNEHNLTQAAALIAKEKNEEEEKRIVQSYLARQKGATGATGATKAGEDVSIVVKGPSV